MGSILFGCSSKDYVVESDYSFNGRFNRYNSYSFANVEGFIGTSEQKEIIESYSDNILSAWGYKKKNKRPDLLIFYSLYVDDISLQGYDQPNLKSWISSKFSNKDWEKIIETDSIDYFENSEKSRGKDDNYNKIRYDLVSGTLLISMVDRKTQETIWQGYASGIFNENIGRNERVMKSIVIQIFEEYRSVAYANSRTQFEF